MWYLCLRTIGLFNKSCLVSYSVAQRIGKTVSVYVHYLLLRQSVYFHVTQPRYRQRNCINHTTLYAQARFTTNWQPRSGPVLLMSESEGDEKPFFPYLSKSTDEFESENWSLKYGAGFLWERLIWWMYLASPPETCLYFHFIGWKMSKYCPKCRLI